MNYRINEDLSKPAQNMSYASEDIYALPYYEYSNGVLSISMDSQELYHFTKKAYGSNKFKQPVDLLLPLHQNLEQIPNVTSIESLLSESPKLSFNQRTSMLSMKSSKRNLVRRILSVV